MSLRTVPKLEHIYSSTSCSLTVVSMVTLQFMRISGDLSYHQPQMDGFIVDC